MKKIDWATDSIEVKVVDWMPKNTAMMSTEESPFVVFTKPETRTDVEIVGDTIKMTTGPIAVVPKIDPKKHVVIRFED